MMILDAILGAFDNDDDSLSQGDREWMESQAEKSKERYGSLLDGELA